MKIGVLKETFPGERRVALVPSLVPTLLKASHVSSSKPAPARRPDFPTPNTSTRGRQIARAGRSVRLRSAVARSRAWGPIRRPAAPIWNASISGKILIAMCDPFRSRSWCKSSPSSGVTLFSLELMPRITRAQSMDVLSSMATVAGYRAVLLAATALPKMFPMMTTAAGTITPAKVFVMGAGVAGLQAIASARRLGAQVSATDVRSAVKEQVQSLGAKFVESAVESGKAEGTGGYAKALDEEVYRKQREALTKVVAESDVVITTAAIPGRKAPILVTAEMVSRMQPGSVIVDLAAERGGNCELTKPGETVVTTAA